MRNPSEILEHLDKAEKMSSTQDKRDDGEFCARILFLLCLPLPNVNKPFSSVRSLFQNLLGEKNLAVLEKNDSARKLMGGNVCFGYFIISEDSDDPFGTIALLICMNAALFMPKDFRGVDIVLPVVLKTGEFGGIYIKVQNLKGKLVDTKGIKNELCTKLVSDKVHRLNIIINVHPYGEDRFEVLGSGQNTTLILEGWKRSFGATFGRYPSLVGTLHSILLRDERPSH
jgi:hypothetical protein